MRDEGCSILTRKTERVVWVDTFRAIMIFFIVLGHALGTKPTANSFIKIYAYSFHVPAFFFISGFLFYTKEESFMKFAGRKARTLMIPYYTFSIASIMAFWLLGSVVSDKLAIAIKTTDIWANIIGMIYANGGTGYMKWNTPLWFLPCLFLTVLIFYFLEKYIINRAKKRTVAIAIAFFVFLVAGFANFYIFHITKLPFGMETVVYLFPFFIAGYWFRGQNWDVKLNKSTKSIICVITLIIGGLLTLCMEQNVDYTFSRYENMLVFYSEAFASIVGYVLLSQLVPCTKISYMGQNTLAILVMHKFPVVVMQMVLMKYMEVDSWLAIGIALLITIISGLLSLVVGQIIKKITPFALGFRRNPKH